MNDTLRGRLSGYRKPVEIDNIVPAESVTEESVAAGLDGDLQIAIDDAQEHRAAQALAVEDGLELTQIGENLEQTARLALEGLGEGTGLHAQTLLAMEIGANQHLARVGDNMTFPSLESDDLTDFEKTEMSLEGLGDKINSIWESVANAAKSAWSATKNFLKSAVDVEHKINSKVKEYKSQLMAVKDHAEGKVTSALASKLYYGDADYRDFVKVFNGALDTMIAYGGDYQSNGLKQSQSVIKTLTSTDANGMPNVDVDSLVSLVKAENGRRSKLMAIGHGTGSKDTDSRKGFTLDVDTSGIVPGNVRFRSVSPHVSGNASAGGEIMEAISECSMSLVKSGSKPSSKELPVLSVKDALSICDRLLKLSDQYGKLYDQMWKVWDEFNAYEGQFEKMSNAFDQIRALSPAEVKEVEESEDFKKAVKKGAKKGFQVLSNFAIIGAAGFGGAAAGATGSAATGISVLIVTYGATVFMYAIPYVLIGAGLGALFNKVILGRSEKFVLDSGPNAPLLHILKSLAKCAGWFGWYISQGASVIGDYTSHIASPILEYLSVSIKAHVKAGATAGNEPVTA